MAEHFMPDKGQMDQDKMQADESQNKENNIPTPSTAAKDKEKPSGESAPRQKYVSGATPEVFMEMAETAAQSSGESKEDARKQAEKAAEMNLSSNEEEKQRFKDEEEVSEQNQAAAHELANYYDSLNKAWISQNPHLAKVYGIDEMQKAAEGNPAPLMYRMSQGVERANDERGISHSALMMRPNDEYLDHGMAPDGSPLMFRNKDYKRFNIGQNAYKLYSDLYDKDDSIFEVKPNSKGKHKVHWRETGEEFDHKKGSPLKQVRHMSRAEAFNMYRQVYANPMANAVGNAIASAGKQIGESIDKAYEERRRRKQELREQEEREAKDFVSEYGGYIQDLQASPGISEATKQLMATEWKQNFAEAKRAYNQGEMSALDFAQKSQELLGNAKMYSDGVGMLNGLSDQFNEMAKNGQISEGMDPAHRDILDTIANSKGFNVVQLPADKDGVPPRKVIGNGLDIKNVAGKPTVMGYTHKHVDKLKAMQKRFKDAGQLPQDQTFEQFLATLPQVGSDPEAYNALPNFYEPQDVEAIRGVNIPIQNIVDGKGVPKILPKQAEIIGAAVDDYTKTLKSDPVYQTPEMKLLTPEEKWQVIGKDRTELYAEQMINKADEPMLRSLAADYFKGTPKLEEIAENLNLPEDDPVLVKLFGNADAAGDHSIDFEEFNELAQQPGGLDNLRSLLKGALVSTVKQQIAPPELAQYYNKPEIEAGQLVEAARERGKEIASLKGGGVRGATGDRPPSAAAQKFQFEQEERNNVLDTLKEFNAQLPKLSEDDKEGFYDGLAQKFQGRGNIVAMEYVPEPWHGQGEEMFEVQLKGQDNTIEVPADKIEDFLRGQFRLPITTAGMAPTPAQETQITKNQ